MKHFTALTFFAICFFHLQLNAQQNIGIGTIAPHSSSLLEVKSNNKGMLVPRINLLSETDVVTIAAPATSLLLYNTNNALTDGEGYYFWNGTKWSKLMNRANVSSLAWSIAGNSGTNTNTDFIGTTDNKPLVFKTNNILSGKIDPGPNNVFFGQSAGAATTSGVNNTFLGHLAGIADSSGSNNLFVGHFAGNENVSGSENVFVGQDAGRKNINGNRNTFVGEDAGVENTGDDNIFIGNGAGRNSVAGNRNAILGNSAFNSNITGSQNAAFGHSALFNNAFGNENAAFGYSALFGNTAGDRNAAFGHNALFTNTSGTANVALGHSALFSNATGNYNSAVGFEALKRNTIGSSNAAFGRSALSFNTTGNDNSAFGSYALAVNSSGDYNTAIGSGALYNNTSGTINTAIGNAALFSNNSGSANTAFGYNALYLNTSGLNNVAIGTNALFYNETGNSNTGIGYNSGMSSLPNPLDNTTSIGFNARVSTSNTMVFGNSSVNRFAFGLNTTNANHALEVGEIVGDGNGAYLTQGGTWTNASDVNKKEDFTIMNGPDLLHKISLLPITRWKYKGSDEYHIGPMAQDFYKQFNVGTDDKGISTIDPAGIALAAIQEQQKIIEKQHELILQLEKRIEALEKK
jgi:trimeric autotransporter adhesin